MEATLIIMDILFKIPLEFIPLCCPEFRIILPVRLASLMRSFHDESGSLIPLKPFFFLSSFELCLLVRCDLLHACFGGTDRGLGVTLQQYCGSFHYYCFIFAVSLNQPGVSGIDFLGGRGVFPPLYVVL